MPVARPGLLWMLASKCELGALKEKHAKMAEQLKEAVRARDSAEAGLKMTDRQFEELRKARDYCDIS